jgi:ADP-heptose:LPS heptosyltransferase
VSDRTFGNICLVHAGAVGDFILALRVVELVKLAWPRATLEVLGRPQIAQVALGRAGVDGVGSVDMSGLHTFFADDLELDPRCVGYFGRFDLVVDMLGGPGGTFGRRVGKACSARVVSIDVSPRPDFAGHVTDQWIDDLLLAGIGPPGQRPGVPKLVFERAERFEARAKLQKLSRAAGEPIVLIHPGAGSASKCWPLESYQALAAALPHSNIQPVFLLGHVELELLGAAVTEALLQFAPVIHGVSLPEAAALIAAADAYVGNDSGMSQVSAAVETPTVALFGPTDPATWRPLGQHVRILEGKVEESSPFAGLDVAVVHRAVLECLDIPARPA